MSRRSVLVVLVVAVAVVGGIVYRYAARGARETSSAQTSRSSTSRAHTTRRSAVSRVPTRLVERSTGRLPAPLQDAAAAATGNRTMLMLGGLTAADTSTNSILLTNWPQPTAASSSGGAYQTDTKLPHVHRRVTWLSG